MTKKNASSKRGKNITNKLVKNVIKYYISNRNYIGYWALYDSTVYYYNPKKQTISTSSLSKKAISNKLVFKPLVNVPVSIKNKFREKVGLKLLKTRQNDN